MPGQCLQGLKKPIFPNPAAIKLAAEDWIHISLVLKNSVQIFTITPKMHFFHLTADELKGTYMLLDEPSVTGTANILMAAVMATGNHNYL